ncbi:hypothetical protein [Alkalihalobacillus sp. TS-13]|uniref:hypothetical protein n=1 Tax=Alkalihalobacillus sp. TS-13 TaxID=2842455 RepID=UPI001C878A0B|nr:hypothetical protein [Alkalihalobacillus sp. TS-13]
MDIEEVLQLIKDGKIAAERVLIVGKAISTMGTVKEFTTRELKQFDDRSWFSNDYNGNRYLS